MQELTIAREGDKATIMPQGDVVTATTGALRAAMRDLTKDGVRALEVDLIHTIMVDSAGIGLLIAAHNSLQKVAGHLSVIHASQDLLELFKSMRIHQHFEISGGK
jgi:anti-anti-sigma factor